MGSLPDFRVGGLGFGRSSCRLDAGSYFRVGGLGFGRSSCRLDAGFVL